MSYLNKYKHDWATQYFTQSGYDRKRKWKENYNMKIILEQRNFKLQYLAIIEWGWVGYEEFCRSRRVLSTEADESWI